MYNMKFLSNRPILLSVLCVLWSLDFLACVCMCKGNASGMNHVFTQFMTPIYGENVNGLGLFHSRSEVEANYSWFDISVMYVWCSKSQPGLHYTNQISMTSRWRRSIWEIWWWNHVHTVLYPATQQTTSTGYEVTLETYSSARYVNGNGSNWA